MLGPTEDGGFYLFGGSRPLPREVWTRVHYSETGTLAELEAGLAEHGTIERAKVLLDVDTREDLPHLRSALISADSLLPEQSALAEWLEAV